MGDEDSMAIETIFTDFCEELRLVNVVTDFARYTPRVCDAATERKSAKPAGQRSKFKTTTPKFSSVRICSRTLENARHKRPSLFDTFR